MQEITKERMEENKQVFLHLLKSIKRENANIDGLISFLESTDFFVAPCSTKYHLGCKGGLVEHCLNVYHNLCMFCNLKRQNISEDTLKIIALCHDFGKIEYYEEYIQNKKVYSDMGSQSDSLGKYDWISSRAYKKRDDCLCIGSHGEAAEYLTRCYIPLTLGESIAIINHMGKWDKADSTDLTRLYKKYPEAVLLHLADMISCYIDEKDE